MFFSLSLQSPLFCQYKYSNTRTKSWCEIGVFETDTLHCLIWMLQSEGADYRQRTMGWGAFARKLAGPNLMAAVDESEGVIDFVERWWDNRPRSLAKL